MNRPTPKRDIAEKALRAGDCTAHDLQKATGSKQPTVSAWLSEWREAGQVQAAGFQRIERRTGGLARIVWRWVR